MRLRGEYDEEADAFYVYLRKQPFAYSKMLDDRRNIDYGADESPIGVELLGVSKGVNVEDLPERAAIGRLLEEHNIRVFA